MRKKLSLKNFFSSFFPYIIVLILGFVKVDIFLKCLGEEIYALNQLFFQLFAYISLAEAGASGYIVQLYYKQFVSDNKDKIIEIFQGSKRFLKKVAIIVMILGIITSFFLRFLTNNHLNNFYMQFVFILFILRSVVEYLMMSPKLVMQADQKLYKVNIVYYIFKILELVFEIGLLLIGMDYVITILSSIVLRTLNYVIINRIVYKEYPWLKNHTKNKEVVKIKGINNMFAHRIAEAVHYNTDIVLASSFLSPFVVTVYSSYNYIVKYLTDGIDLVGNSISASVGNVIYKENNQDKVKILDELIVSYFCFAIFFTAVCCVSINSFINLWIGSKYIISSLGLIFLMINLFIVISRKPLNIYYQSAGWYKETRLIVCLEALVNLVLSIVLVLKFSLVGLLISTCISMLTTTFWYIPKFVLMDNLKQKISIYFAKLFGTFILTVFLSFLGIIIFNLLNIKSYIIWATFTFVYSLFVIFMIFIIMMIFSKPFKRVYLKFIDMLKRKKKIS